MAKNDEKTQGKDKPAVETATKAQAEEKSATAAPPTDHLVPMKKDGVTLHVHPAAVAAHRAIGWEAS